MIELINANSLSIPLADQSIHMVVTSPPYWALRDYGVSNQLGLEKLHDCLGWANGEKPPLIIVGRTAKTVPLHLPEIVEALGKYNQ